MEYNRCFFMCAISNWMRQLDNLVMKGCKFYSLKKDLNLPLPGCRVILFVMVGYNVTDTATPVYCINKTRDFRCFKFKFHWKGKVHQTFDYHLIHCECSGRVGLAGLSQKMELVFHPLVKKSIYRLGISPISKEIYL